MIKKILVLLLFFLPSGVFALGVNSTMEDIMGSWVGENINTVIARWGYPGAEKNLAGKKLYYWYRDSNLYTPMSYDNYTCTKVLEVDKNNTVINYQWEGDSCPFSKLYLYKNWVNPAIKNDGQGYVGVKPKL